LLHDGAATEGVFVNMGGVNSPEVAMIDFEEEGRDVMASTPDQQDDTGTAAVPRVVQSAVSSVTADDDGEVAFTYTYSAADVGSDIVFAMARYCNAAEGVWMQHEPVAFQGGDPNIYHYLG
jgi:hypothetical protein